MKYKLKNTVLVEAVQFDPQARPWPVGVIPWSDNAPRPRDMSWGYVQTVYGSAHVIAGDWIVTNEQGDRAVCPEDIFAATYEPVEER